MRAMPSTRDALNTFPSFFPTFPAYFGKRAIPIDVALLNVSPPDAHGYCSLGTSVDVTLAAAECARIVIAQINPRMPRTHGDGFLHVGRIDFGVAVDEPPHAHVEADIGDVERRIGALVAELVPDEATLQLGIGAIPSAIASALQNKRHLGIHTEMFTDAIIDLVEKGVVTGAKKEINRGKIVSSFVLGTQRLYDFVHDNPLVELRPSDYTNDTAVIRRFRRMVAVNSAIEIDLDRTGLRRLDRHATLQRSWRADGLPSRCGDSRGGAGDHCPPVHRIEGHSFRASYRCSSQEPAW